MTKTRTLATALVALVVSHVPLAQQATDRRALVSRSDLVYTEPVTRSEEGIPIGNGRMGTLVWTTPAAMKFQINRVDIQPINKNTRSFFERNTDYMGGAGFVDIELAGAGEDAFPADGTTQRLSVYARRRTSGAVRSAIA